MNIYDICVLHAHSDRSFRASVGAVLQDANITMMEWLLLGVVKAAPAKGVSMSEIAGALNVTLPQVTALINKLLPLKLVRQKSASTDRRSRLVALTSKGELVFDEASKALIAAQQGIFEGISEEDINTYVTVLKKLSQKAV